MADYLNTKSLADAAGGVRDMKAPKHFLPEMLSKMMVCSLDRPDEDREHVSTLIHALRADGLITAENFMQVRRPPPVPVPPVASGAHRPQTTYASTCTHAFLPVSLLDCFLFRHHSPVSTAVSVFSVHCKDLNDPFTYFKRMVGDLV